MNTSILRKYSIAQDFQRILTPDSPGGRLISAGMTFAMQRHPFFEVLLVLDGSCDFPLNHKLFNLTPGTAVIISPWCLHPNGYLPQDDGLLHLWLHFNSGYAGCVEVHHGHYFSCPELNYPIPKYLEELFRVRWTLWEESEEKGAEQAVLCFRNLFNLFLDELYLNHDLEKEQGKRNIVRETLSIIRQFNGRGCSLDMLAKQIGCSKYHLAHSVQKETNRSIGSFIDEARRDYVTEALRHGLRQKEIACDLGFASPAAFWNWFHRKMK